MKQIWMHDRHAPRLALLALLALLLAVPGPAQTPAGKQPAKAPWEFFSLDNGVGRGSWTPEQQAATMKELGYDGIGYNYTKPADLAKWIAAEKAAGIKLYSLYIYTFIDKPAHYQPGLREAIKLLKGTDCLVWMTLRETQDKKKTGYDDEAAAMVSEVADWAKEAGVKVALYPHAGFYVANAEEALRIVKKVNRPDVGMTINFCHELMQKNGDKLGQLIQDAGDHLFLVTVNGADKDGKPNGYIQTLDKGSFDVYGFLKSLKAAGYKGPVGLQGFSIKGEPKENLTHSMDAWKKFSARLAAEEK